MHCGYLFVLRQGKKQIMLIDKYRTIFKNDEKWKYYSQIHFPNNPFDDKNIADKFIIEYFKNGNKQNVLDTNFPKDKDRDIHTISTFFLGILLKPFCNIHELKPDFRYLWFIACLYHDYGYHIEKDKTKYTPKNSSIKNLLRILKIKNNFLTLEYYKGEKLETITKYYDFCRKEYCFINHGIIGGLMLYDRLKKNYIDNKNKAKREGIKVENDDFIYNELHWSLKHDVFYREIADAIISHNIWYAYSEKDKSLYESYQIKSLSIQNKSERVSLNSNPFLFLLLLADTIEPIKSFNQISYDCLLEKIDIEIIEGSKILISVNDNCLNYKVWFSKILDLENWMSLKISNNEEKKLLIEIE